MRLDVPYVSASSDPKQQLDLYLPRETKPFPMVVFVHGGYWSAQDRRWLQPVLGTYGNVGAALAHRGIGAAIVGYRQFPQVQRGDDSLDDIARAIRFVAQSAAKLGADPLRIFVMGHSAGGHLASLLAMDPRILQRNDVAPGTVAGVISVDGIFDLRASLRYLKADQVKVMSTLFGPDDAALAEHSTIHHLGSDHPPILFVDSTDDEEICREGFRALRELAQRDANAEFVELDGLGHNEIIIRAGMSDDPITTVVARFVAEGRGR
ncbi:Esterase/lipase [Vulgatibacter incomptus]|uniref:Esterase/lipase n=1 Tax=Vulgatibacter incomptus TaxID=1391653 RepID=A0A0K1PGK6_9BACT|nr:Esterase/lipase [Vulgatibacter incomptus]